MVLSSVQPKQFPLVFAFPDSKPFECLVVFKELSESAKENAKLLELEIVVPVLPVTLHICIFVEILPPGSMIDDYDGHGD